MQIKRFIATDVHDYLNFDAVFRPDVNFIAGLNGTGKTTALIIIMSLLTPDIKKLMNIKFSTARLLVENDKKIYDIQCEKNKGEIILSCSVNGKSVGAYKRKNLESIDNEYRVVRWIEHSSENDAQEVIETIQSLSPPIFLSLDRRFIKTTRESKVSMSTLFEGRQKKVDAELDSLDEAISIISKAVARAQMRQSAVDDSLRNDILKNALKPYLNDREAFKIPNAEQINTLREKHNAIISTLKQLKIPSEDFETFYTGFFERIVSLSTNKDGSINIDTDDKEHIQIFSEWVINQAQLRKINEIFSLIERHNRTREKIYGDLNRFKNLINCFLKETNKEIILGYNEQPKIMINKQKREIDILSSGESQILIMLAHLVLNKGLPRNGVFIVDEPELSLHISWQDMFVESVQAANPDLQIILATHSPAIIGGRNEMYIPLNGGSYQ
ncbi:AAA family ATPase [Aeromonas enteropelogenes]|uniref:AAA family ATPase n=1 Tax=Aeromonas enteropelogenes TaxID=29489 RepID=UPI003B9F26FE